jgi:predicted nucleotidyltransferase
MDNPINGVVERYAKAVNQRYAPKAIYLYGSYARGKAKQDSDIDIAVIFDPMDNDEYISTFSGLSSIAAKIDYNIEPNLLIDNGDYCRFSFLAEVMETGQLIEA